MSGRKTFVPEIFEISLKSRDFRFFFRFFYEARHSAVFQPTYRKCMSGDNSILPISDSVPFKKQMQIFNAIFEKKNRSMRPTHYAAIFPISVGGAASHGISFSVFLRECRRKQFLKYSHQLSSYQLFIDWFFFSFAEGTPGGC